MRRAGLAGVLDEASQAEDTRPQLSEAIGDKPTYKPTTGLKRSLVEGAHTLSTLVAPVTTEGLDRARAEGRSLGAGELAGRVAGDVAPYVAGALVGPAAGASVRGVMTEEALRRLATSESPRLAEWATTRLAQASRARGAAEGLTAGATYAGANALTGDDRSLEGAGLVTALSGAMGAAGGAVGRLGKKAIEHLSESSAAKAGAATAGGMALKSATSDDSDLGWGDLAPVAGVAVPFLDRGKGVVEFAKHVTAENIPERYLPGTHKKIAKAIAADTRAENFGAREIATQYMAGGLDLDEAEMLFRRTQSTLFDDLERNTGRQRGAQISNPKFHSYKETTQSVSANRGNLKTRSDTEDPIASELSGMDTHGTIKTHDTSRGCVGGRCVACYGASCTNQGRIFHYDTVPVELKGDLAKAMRDPDNSASVVRVGETGEPNANPEAYAKVKGKLMGMFKRAQNRPDSYVSVDSQDRILSEAGVYDWSHTMNELRKVNATDPDLANKLFVITKLHSVTGFDPSVVRNLQVSIDPMIPKHFFRTLRNVDRLRELDPTLNIVLRMKSVPSASDEINSLQLIAAQFAKERNLDVLETRTRFENWKQAEGVLLDNSVSKRKVAGKVLNKHIGDATYAINGVDWEGIPAKGGSITRYDKTAEKRIRENTAFAPFAKFVGMKESKLHVCNRLGDSCVTCRNCFKLTRKGVPHTEGQ
jgi:hypothetical protein